MLTLESHLIAQTDMPLSIGSPERQPQERQLKPCGYGGGEPDTFYSWEASLDILGQEKIQPWRHLRPRSTGYEGPLHGFAKGELLLLSSRPAL